MSIPTARDLLLAYDAQRPRTLQQEMGISALGGCRRKAGYMARRYPEDPGFESNAVQAVLGTAIHEVLAKGAGLVVPDAHAETLEVQFGGLVGHPDLLAGDLMIDYKTLGYSMQLEQRRKDGPSQSELWQVMVYGAAAILAGHPVNRVRLNWIARDSGEEVIWEEAFEPSEVTAAMRWLQDVRSSDPAILPRDYRPDSATCKACPYFERCWQAKRGTDDRTVLFLDDPDVNKWALQLWQAGLDRKRAGRQEKDAKGALDHLRTVSRPGEHEEIALTGLDDDDVLRFSVGRGKTGPDMKTITEDYARVGERPPLITGNPVIKVALVKRKHDDQ